VLKLSAISFPEIEGIIPHAMTVLGRSVVLSGITVRRTKVFDE
jgi:hypothetical protein